MTHDRRVRVTVRCLGFRARLARCQDRPADPSWWYGCTLAATTGASVKELMTRMGHAGPAAVIYQHATSERDRLIADALNDRIAGARGRGKTDGPRQRQCCRSGQLVARE